MESPNLLEQERHGWDKPERILASFLVGALAALALYLEAWSIEIDSVTGTGQRLVEVDLIRLPLIKHPSSEG
jgi:hypothetical protein